MVIVVPVVQAAIGQTVRAVLIVELALERLDVDPASTFWLGRLASEDHVFASQLGDRAERLDPCAIGLRVRPSGDDSMALLQRRLRGLAGHRDGR